MNENQKQLDNEHRTLVELMESYESMTNATYSEIIFKDIGLLLQIVDSFKKEEIKLQEWEIWFEPLLLKLSFHGSSLLDLFKGTRLPFVNQENYFVVFDESSIISLLRVVLENYLTFYFLYADNITKEEKQFRVNVWKYSGLTQRTEFEFTTENAKQKQIEGLKDLAQIKTEIEASNLFSSCNSEMQKKILKGRSPRLSNSWIKLIEKSGLRMNLFKNMYGYKSNYAHSEFISAMQIRMGTYGFNKDSKGHYALFSLHFIICKSILDLSEIFPSANKLFNSLNESEIMRIKELVWFATTNDFNEEESNNER